jgi:hypothetical protein
MRSARLGLVFGCLALLGCALSGCAGTEQTKGGQIDRGEPPSFAEIARKYNQRVAGLDRVWARSTVRFQGADDKGQKIDEQGEGYLQVIRPRKLYMTVGKVGDVGYELGSDDYRYWWIDAREKFALVGRHERATQTMLERAGLPVAPLDVMAVLGITELRQEGAGAPVIAWSKGGDRLVVTMIRSDGTKEMRLDPERFEPLEIAIKNKQGATTVRAELSEYEEVLSTEKAAGGGGDPSRMATRIHVVAPKQQTEITMWLHDAENKGNRIKERSFDFDAQVREFRVQRVKDLDEPSRAKVDEPR